MTFSDMEMGELGRKHETNIHNTRSLICNHKYILDILQTEEAFTVEEYKNKYVHTHLKFKTTKAASRWHEVAIISLWSPNLSRNKSRIKQQKYASNV